MAMRKPDDLDGYLSQYRRHCSISFYSYKNNAFVYSSTSYSGPASLRLTHSLVTTYFFGVWSLRSKMVVFVSVPYWLTNSRGFAIYFNVHPRSGDLGRGARSGTGEARAFAPSSTAG